MASTETSLESNEIVLALVILARMIRHNVFTQGSTKRQLLLEAILQQAIGPIRVFLPQVVNIHD